MLSEHNNWLNPAPRPKLRRDPLPDPWVFQLRIDLEGARPPIWRRISIRSDQSLETLHIVIQAAFDWYNYHLYRFSIGGGPFDLKSELFLCEYDLTEADPADEGTFVEDVRVDETLQQPGDVLHYLYDYGDTWAMKIVLEELRPASPDSPIAECVGGRRAAPPEDCGGLTDADQLAEVLDDPAHFDLDHVNSSIRAWLDTPPGFAPQHLLTRDEAHAQDALLRYPQFAPMIDAPQAWAARDPLTERLHRLHAREFAADTGLEELLAPDDRSITGPIDDAVLHESLSAVQCLLDRVGTGVKLTQAGYLPVDVALDVADELGLTGYRRSTGGESKMHHVYAFREALQKVGLLRKSRGMLHLTQAGQHARTDQHFLWNHLADRMLPKPSARRDFAHDSALMVLLFAATSSGPFDLDEAAALLSAAGWSVDGTPVKAHTMVFAGAWQSYLLWYIAPRGEREWFAERLSPAAIHLAAAALAGMERA